MIYGQDKVGRLCLKITFLRCIFECPRRNDRIDVETLPSSGGQLVAINERCICSPVDRRAKRRPSTPDRTRALEHVAGQVFAHRPAVYSHTSFANPSAPFDSLRAGALLLFRLRPCLDSARPEIAAVALCACAPTITLVSLARLEEPSVKKRYTGTANSRSRSRPPRRRAHRVPAAGSIKCACKYKKRTREGQGKKARFDECIWFTNAPALTQPK